MHIYIHIVCVYIHMYIYMCVCVCAYRFFPTDLPLAEAHSTISPQSPMRSAVLHGIWPTGELQKWGGIDYDWPPNQWINMVTRICTTLRFWHPCNKTPHVLPFLLTSICTCDDEKLEEPFFPLACGRRLSLRHVIAIDPLVDSIPRLTIDWLSGQCGTSSDWDNLFSGDSNNDQSVGCLQLSSFPALAPS